ncbi:hypothetical protein C7S16_3254 [Burkholderia thailandensis]|uniref:Uncharacterized protein n=1 Tax=Burkholderia thailandensis TaxID=57975 RepID=A0AAW9D424_BURTH|nr:hypothetical protein [Burkholderia thailandensis]MDW9256256.1 hypothetical protein [Burkholderia thailandensis]
MRQVSRTAPAAGDRGRRGSARVPNGQRTVRSRVDSASRAGAAGTPLRAWLGGLRAGSSEAGRCVGGSNGRARIPRRTTESPRTDRRSNGARIAGKRRWRGVRGGFGADSGRIPGEFEGIRGRFGLESSRRSRVARAPGNGAPPGRRSNILRPLRSMRGSAVAERPETRPCIGNTGGRSAQSPSPARHGRRPIGPCRSPQPVKPRWALLKRNFILPPSCFRFLRAPPVDNPRTQQR